jgi:hypothetical protein
VIRGLRDAAMQQGQRRIPSAAVYAAVQHWQYAHEYRAFGRGCRYVGVKRASVGVQSGPT